MKHVSLHNAERRQARESAAEAGEGNLLLLEQSRWFAGYFSDDSGGEGFSSRAPEGVAQTAEPMLDAFAEQLQMRLSGVAQWPLNMSLYLPRWGRIKVCAGREHQAWDITLEAEEARTARWLASVREDCQERLCRTLGQPVSLRLAKADDA